MRSRQGWVAVMIVAGCAIGVVSGARAKEPDAAQRTRSAPPKNADVDGAATIESLLSRTGQDDWSTKRAARLEGYVIQVEKEPDLDIKIVLAAAPNETDTGKWVVAEVTPSWLKKSATLSERRLRKLVGKKIRATGWLFYDQETGDRDPRGTRWEIHPATSITVVEAK